MLKNTVLQNMIVESGKCKKLFPVENECERLSQRKVEKQQELKEVMKVK